MNENKPLQFSSMRRMEVAAVLYFLRKGVKLHFYSLGTIPEENMWVSRGMQSLGSGFPIGARSIPVGTRFCLQSLVGRVKNFSHFSLQTLL